MKQRILVYGITLLLLGALALGAKLYGEHAQANLQAGRVAEKQAAESVSALDRVKVCRVFAQPLTDVLRLPGTVEAFHDIELAARMDGQVEWIGPEEGDAVERGEKVLQIDVEDLRAQVAQARTAHELARQRYERVESLRNSGVASGDDYDSAAANLKTTQAALEAIEVTLRYGALHAPIGGVVDRRYVDPGEHVGGGQPVMKIVNIDRVKVVFNVPEKDVLFFKPGQKVDLQFENGRLYVFTGTIESVALTADPVTRTYPLKVIVDNGDRLLRPGMIVRGNLIRRHIEEAIAVPLFTIVDQEDGKAVYVVEDGVARERPIDYGVMAGGMVEIRDGLELGEQLVVVGHRRLVDGEPVEIAADVTELARRIILGGEDLSQLAMQLIR